THSRPDPHPARSGMVAGRGGCRHRRVAAVRHIRRRVPAPRRYRRHAAVAGGRAAGRSRRRLRRPVSSPAARGVRRGAGGAAAGACRTAAGAAAPWPGGVVRPGDAGRTRRVVARRAVPDIRRHSAMSGFDWLPAFVERLAAHGVRLENSRFPDLEPARTVAVARESWGRAAAAGHAFELRFAGLWGDPVDGGIVVRACLVRGGECLVLVTETPGDVPAAECGDDFALPSMASWYPGASRLERHLADMLGVRMSGQDDGRRWTRHRAWREGEFPLRCDFPVQGLPPRRTPSDDDYAFRAIQGSGVCEIPVGPVHAG